MASNEIVCADAIEWLAGVGSGVGAIVTSPPDAEEIGLEPSEWRDWFIAALRLCVNASDGPCVFYVTDRRFDSGIVSKSHMVLEAASDAGLAWHKIALRRDPGKIDLYRPGFSHLIAFGGKAGKATPDVFDRGSMLYKNGTGLKAARIACEWAGQYSKTIIDPFCGRGTIPAVAEALGYMAIGVDIDQDQCTHAKALKLSIKQS
jgi:hypothetical protein